jgi:hypothetical protein
MTIDGINITYPELITDKHYKIELYTTYRRYYGNLSGIYNSDFTEYPNYYYDYY